MKPFCWNLHVGLVLDSVEEINRLPSQTQGAKERQLETTELKLEALQKRKTMGGVRGGDKRGCVSLIQMTRACILCYFYNANISDWFHIAPLNNSPVGLKTFSHFTLVIANSKLWKYEIWNNHQLCLKILQYSWSVKMKPMIKININININWAWKATSSADY